MSGPLVITIDGPAGVGKTTLARRAAEALHCAYLDTGAMFRTLALELSSGLPEDAGNGTPALQGEALACRLEAFFFALEGSGGRTALLCNGRRIGNEIRTEEAAMAASKIGQLPEVRTFLKAAQQRLGAEFSLVAEGRDMGTEVFPGAACKIFLEARPEVRALRRFRQLQAMGKPADLAELTEQIRKRDEEDRNRALAPLRPATDARIIDTSDMDIDGVFAAVMQAARASAEKTCWNMKA